MLWATQKVEQHTMNLKQELIKLKVEHYSCSLNISSGDFDITQARAQGTGQSTIIATFRGDGEFIMKIKDLYQTLYLKLVIHKLH